MLSMVFLSASLVAAPLYAEEQVSYQELRTEKIEGYTKEQAKKSHTSHMHTKRQKQKADDKTSSDEQVKALENKMSKELKKEAPAASKQVHAPKAHASYHDQVLAEKENVQKKQDKSVKLQKNMISKCSSVQKMQKKCKNMHVNRLKLTAA